MTQLCPALWDPWAGILQARILEWVAYPFSRASSQPRDGMNPGLRHCRRILYQLSHKGSPRILEWVGYPFISRSYQPRNQTGVSCTVGGFFTNCAIRELIPINESESHSVVSDSLQLHGLYSPWNSPGQNTGVGSLSLFQGIFPIQGSNPGLPHCRQILYLSRRC